MDFDKIYEASKDLDAPLQSVEDGLPVREGTEEDKDTKKSDPLTMKKAADAYEANSITTNDEEIKHIDITVGEDKKPEPKQPPKPPSKFAQLLDDALKKEK
ncbi:hypothetical protein AGMMS49991_05590 [Spirochaetia bacterium]|nr:hypothetical protein AGMMS49991_05590 [Spirochaetia bacterium]